jgi:hypothetical protein
VEQDRGQPLVIRTSVAGWMSELAKAYRSKTPLELVDDALVGIDPRSQTILDMGRKGRLTAQEWTGVLVTLGVASVGAWLLVMAVLDPEPYSKVAAAIATGAILLGSGGFYAVRILTKVKPPGVRVSKTGHFEISWD